jgi:E3 ubiquitin-protein ligase HUWE1
LVRNNPKLLRGSFSLLVRNPKVLEFDNKRNYFTQKLHKKPSDLRPSITYVNVRRQYIFQDSYYQLQNKHGDELKYGKLSIRFYDEEAADYGGVSREWYQELTKEMFNPNYALFTPSAEKMG